MLKKYQYFMFMLFIVTSDREKTREINFFPEWILSNLNIHERKNLFGLKCSKKYRKST